MGRRVRTVQDLAALRAAGDGYIVNLAGCGDYWNIVHALSCRECRRLDPAYGEKRFYATLAQAQRDLDWRVGYGRYRSCKICIGSDR